MSKLKIRDQNDPNTWYEVPAGGVGVPSGGTKGQVLKKSSATDYSTEWADDVQIYIQSSTPTSSSPDGLYFVTS